MHISGKLSFAHRTSRDRARAAVDRLADSLRCRPETLMASAWSERFPDQTAELIRLWFKLPTSGQRQAVLDKLRALAGREGG